MNEIETFFFANHIEVIEVQRVQGTVIYRMTDGIYLYAYDRLLKEVDMESGVLT